MIGQKVPNHVCKDFDGLADTIYTLVIALKSLENAETKYHSHDPKRRCATRQTNIICLACFWLNVLSANFYQAPETIPLG